jgi:glycine C-acetyltransferase
MDNIEKRIKMMTERVNYYKSKNLYYYNIPVRELKGGSRVLVDGREMIMLASYSYLGLIGHPRINEAAKKAIDKYGTGTHGVRTLAGSLPVHVELEETIAEFKKTEAAIVFSSGYVTNLSVIQALVGRGDYVISDKYNHASIVDGILISGAKLVRYPHNDLDALEKSLAEIPSDATKLVVTDAVFSMDGDYVDLPRLVEICRKFKAWLMVDEAHSVGVLGKTGRGIEEHFGMENVIDIKMGTLSKTIPSVGGYIAGSKDLIDYLRHSVRGYIFSAALPPAQAAAAAEAFRVIMDEPWRVEQLRRNTDLFLNSLKSAGFDTLYSQTAIVPIICGDDDTAFEMTRACHARDLFVLPVVSPAVPQKLARLRTTVTAAHTERDIEIAVERIMEAAKEVKPEIMAATT